MHTKEQILEDIDDSTKELIDILTSFPEKDFNTKLDENQWSAGEVADHLIILEGYINNVLAGKTKETERNWEDKIDWIKKGFLDFEKKYNAPGVIRPSENKQSKQDCINKVLATRKRFSELVDANDITVTCTDFVHKVFGELTITEMAYFNIYHTKRHIHQIENLKEYFANY